jgi:hypothetical protein
MGYPRKKFDAHKTKRRMQKLPSHSMTGAVGKTRSEQMTERYKEKKDDNVKGAEDKSEANALSSRTESCKMDTPSNISLP